MSEHEKQFLDEIKAETRDLRRKDELSALLGERVLFCVLLRSEGHTYKEIGEKISVGARRSAQLFRQGWREYDRAKNDTSGLIGLSVRARNCMHRAGLSTAEEVKDAILAGELTEQTYLGEKIVSYGKRTYRELCDFFGVPVAEKKVSTAAIERAIRFLENNGYEVKERT